MRKLLIVIAFLGITGSLAAQTEGKQFVEIKTSAQCGMCKATIEKAVGNIEGVKVAELDLATKIISVKYDAAKTNTEAIQTAITASGYDADAIPADAKAYEGLHSCCKKE